MEAAEKVQDGIDFDDGVEETTEVESQAEEVEVEEESQPEPQEEPEEGRIEFDERQQEFIEKKIISRFVARAKAAEERAQEYERQLQEIQSKAQQPQQADPQTGEPVIPPMPDIWDPQYEEKIQQRDEAIGRHYEWKAEQKAQERLWQQEALRHQEELNKRTQAYVKRGKEMGVSAEDIQRAGQMINDAGGLPIELVDVILDDDAGPAITKYLSRNLMELQQLQQMPPHRAALYLATNIKPKAARSAKRSSAPPPIETERGHAGASDERGPKGAVYE